MTRKPTRVCPKCSKPLVSQGYGTHVRFCRADKITTTKRTEKPNDERTQKVPGMSGRRKVFSERTGVAPRDESQNQTRTVSAEQRNVAEKIGTVFPVEETSAETSDFLGTPEHPGMNEPDSSTTEGPTSPQGESSSDGSTPPPSPFDVEALLAYADVGCAAVITFARANGASIESAKLDSLCRLSAGEREQLRPLLEQSREVFGRWLRPTPEGAAYTVLGLYAFALWARWRTARALERVVAARDSEPQKTENVQATEPRDVSNGFQRMPGNPVERL